MKMKLKQWASVAEIVGARSVHVETARRYLVELYSAWDRPEDAARYSAEVGPSL